MSRSPFDPGFEALPGVLPVFPLPGVLLLPGGRLPLNIFEPRYLAMVGDALAGARLIGMIQPNEKAPDVDNTDVDNTDVGSAAVYRIGCAGRIVAFSETDDGRYLITLAGLLRFDVAAEVTAEGTGHGGYRRVVPDFAPYRGDLEEDGRRIDRTRLFEALDLYFQAAGIEADWPTMEKAGDEQLVASLAMGCPFEPSEKQALLEAMTLPERAQTMTTILRMAAHDGGRGPSHH